MNNINFQQTGGFPLETDTLGFMQEAYMALQNIAAIGGENYILSGCTVTGNNVSDGYMVLNKEVIPFQGGLQQSGVIIREVKQTRPFENGQTKEVFKTRYASFGTGEGVIPFGSILRLRPLSDFRELPVRASSELNLDDDKTLATSKAVKLLNEKVSSQIPSGCILIWSGSIQTIPSGFALCDGQAGRPDLRDRFVYGAGKTYAVGDYGGAETHVLKINEIPSHTHNAYIGHRVNDGGSMQTIASGLIGGSSGQVALPGSTGGGMAHNNMPPYYVLAYIIKL